MSLAVEMTGITKRFASVVANDSVDFALEYGTVHAIVGENGAGKTTLMRILCGIYQADSGVIKIDGKPVRYTAKDAQRLGIAMVHQNFMQIPGMSILENVILGHAPQKMGVINYKRARGQVAELLRSMGMKNNPSDLVKNLSVGERQKIEIIKALYLGARIIIFDEPTAVLTPQEVDGLFEIIQTLRDEGKGIIYISHKLNEVIAVADCATVMRHGRLVRKFGRGEEMTRQLLASAMVGDPEFTMVTSKSGKAGSGDVLLVKNLCAMDISATYNKLQNLSFSVGEGEILGIAGVEGNGQQELIQTLMGLVPGLRGTIELCGADVTGANIHSRRERGLGYISEDRMITGVSLELGIEDNLVCGKESDSAFSRFGLMRHGVIRRFARDSIEHFDVRGGRLDIPVRSLSGGNLQKVILAREISRKPKLLIAAHPTRGLDIGAINFVRAQLLEQKAAGTGILLITADLDELFALSDRILVMYEGRFSGEITDVAGTSVEQLGLLMGGVEEANGGEAS